MPKMKHADSKQTIEVSPAQVAMYESQGWRKVSAPKKKTAAPDPASTATTKE